MDNKLKIYKSSAGSGKTFTLVKEYLRIVLRQPEEYRHVLAITFTNKAAEEMKSRVIEALVSLEDGQPSDLRSQLEKEIPGAPITENAGKVLRSILHDYPNFSISTIDSFFQRLLRSLARELNLPLRVELKLEEEDAILDVSDRLLKKSDQDKELSEWLQHFMFRKLDEDKGWDIQSDIALIAKELLKERGASATTLSRDVIHRLTEDFTRQRKAFEESITLEAKAILDAMEKFGIGRDRFYYSDKGVYGFIRKAAAGGHPDEYELGERTLRALGGPEGWVKKEDEKDADLMAFISREAHPRLVRIQEIIQSGFRAYASNFQLLKTLYLYGIVTDLTRLFSEYRKDHNQILISDTAKMLQEIITGDDTPFIYEKTGNRYKYLLIDEFQDTSEAQWFNMLPLVINSLSSGFMALVVGDAKQSIYRWRGGDLRLLLEGIHRHLQQFRNLIHDDHLDTNYRSKKEIVAFNNEFFTSIVQVIRSIDGLDDLKTLESAYGKEVEQKTAARNKEGGYVEVRWLENDSSKDSDPLKWEEKALNDTLSTISGLLEKGYRYRDICILVRNKKHGNDIAHFLFKNGINKVISPDSLIISGSSKVRFLINLFRLLIDSQNSVARGLVLHHYCQSQGGGESLHQLFAQPKKSKREGARPAQSDAFTRLMPEEFIRNMPRLAKLPVYEISEELVRIFGLGGTPDAFIQRFQDLVLEFNSRQHASLRSFLEWWDNDVKAREKSVIIPENENAIRIMTIHKSKGLQFPVVIMPYMDWDLFPKTGEMVWLASDEAPYEQLGTIGILAADHLKDSAFEKEWRIERSNSLLDNINLMYVAFTRPEQELYLFAPLPSKEFFKKREINSTAKLLYTTLVQTEMTPGPDGVAVKGIRPDAYVPKQDILNSEALNSYPVNKWTDKIRVSSRTRKLADILKERSTDKVRYGVLVHELLAAIGTLDDVDAVLEKIRFEGLIPEDQKEGLRELVMEVTSHPDIRKFFDTDWEVRRESEILTPGAEVFRPDRTLIKGDSAMVVDFKTGAPDSSHREQLSHYNGLLRNMGYKDVSGYLIYLKDTVSVTEVPD